MSVNWKDSVCRSVGPVLLNDPSSYVVPFAAQALSPIDRFYEGMDALLQTATPSFLASHRILGPTFLGGVMAASEEFLRAIIGGVVRVCSVAQVCAADRQIQLGSAIWHGQDVVGRGALEGASLAGKANVTKTVKEFVDYKLTATDQCWSVLDQYERLCQIRHAAIHSGLVMPGKNAVKLGVKPVQGVGELYVGFDELQEAAAICSALVATLNADLFAVVAERWATTWPASSGWTAEIKRHSWNATWDLFYSSVDASRGLIGSPTTRLKCRNAVAAAFA